MDFEDEPTNYFQGKPTIKELCDALELRIGTREITVQNTRFDFYDTVPNRELTSPCLLEDAINHMYTAIDEADYTVVGVRYYDQRNTHEMIINGQYCGAEERDIAELTFTAATHQLK